MAACSSGGSAAPSTTTSTVAATTTTTRPPVTTAARTTTIARTTTTVARTTTSTTIAPTTTTTEVATTTGSTLVLPTVPTTQPPAAPCDPTTLLQVANTKFGPFPEGTTLSDPRCVESYASAILVTPGRDNAFVVFRNPEGEWDALSLGTSEVCSQAAIPRELFDPLNCTPWES